MAVAQLPTPEQVLARNHWFALTNNNLQLHSDKFNCPHPEFVLILKGHPLWTALTKARSVPAVYMHQFWHNISKQGENLTTTIDQTQVTITKELIRLVLELPGPNHYADKNDYDVTRSNEQICEDICNLGYDGPLSKTNHFRRMDLAEPWQTLFILINKCLSPKHAGHDKANVNVMRIFHGIALHLHYDFAEHIWADFQESVKSKRSNKQGGVLPYMRFTGLLISHFMAYNSNIRPRPLEIYHPPRLPVMHQDRQQPRANPKVIPLTLLNLANQAEPKISAYRRKFYEGDNLRAKPLNDDQGGTDYAPAPPSPLGMKSRLKRRHEKPSPSSQPSSEPEASIPVTSIPMLLPLSAAPIVSSSILSTLPSPLTTVDTSEIQASISQTVSSILVDLARSFSIPEQTSTVGAPPTSHALDSFKQHDQIVDNSEELYSFGTTIPCSTSVSISQDSSPMSTTMQGTSIAASLQIPIYPDSTTCPTIIRIPPVHIPEASSASIVTKADLQAFQSEMNNKMTSTFQSFKDSLLTDIQNLFQSTSKDKGKGIATEEERPFNVTRPQPTFSDFANLSTADMKSYLFACLLRDNPRSKATDLLGILLEEHPAHSAQRITLGQHAEMCNKISEFGQSVQDFKQFVQTFNDSCKQANLKRRHEDTDDSDHPEGEKRQRTTETEIPPSQQSQPQQPPPQTSQRQPPQTSHTSHHDLQCVEVERKSALEDLSENEDDDDCFDNFEDDLIMKPAVPDVPELDLEAEYEAQLAADVDELFEDQPTIAQSTSKAKNNYTVVINLYLRAMIADQLLQVVQQMTRESEGVTVQQFQEWYRTDNLLPLMNV